MNKKFYKIQSVYKRLMFSLKGKYNNKQWDIKIEDILKIGDQ